MDRFYRWLSWKLPKRLIYYCAIRLIAYATTNQWSNTDVTKLTAMDALDRWEEPYNG